MPDDSQLTPDEIRVLKEAAQTMISSGRVGRLVSKTLLWLAGMIGASVFVWEFILKGFGKS
jgi:hypothetical protein